jgi:hypothetical protein
MAPIATDFDPLSGKLFVSFLGVTGRRKSDLEQAARFAQIVAKSAEVGVSPAAVASGLSRDIGESPGAHFPFFFASIDLNRLTGAYSCGGQCPIVVGEGAVTVLEQTGPPLGFSPSVEYDEEFFSLASGHTLMVYNFDLAIGFSVDRMVEQALACKSDDAFLIRDRVTATWAHNSLDTPGRKAAMFVLQVSAASDRRAFFGVGPRRSPAVYQKLESHIGRPAGRNWVAQDLIFPA